MVREIAADIKPVLLWKADAADALQEHAKAHLMWLGEDVKLCAIYAKRITMLRTTL